MINIISLLNPSGYISNEKSFCLFTMCSHVTGDDDICSGMRVRRGIYGGDAHPPQAASEFGVEIWSVRKKSLLLSVSRAVLFASPFRFNDPHPLSSRRASKPSISEATNGSALWLLQEITSSFEFHRASTHKSSIYFKHRLQRQSQ
jgi:hypothetical protein